MDHLRSLIPPVEIVECKRYLDGGSLSVVLQDKLGEKLTICFSYPLLDEKQWGVYLGKTVANPGKGAYLRPGSTLEHEAMDFLLGVMDAQFGLDQLHEEAAGTVSMSDPRSPAHDGAGRLERIVAVWVLPEVESRLGELGSR